MTILDKSRYRSIDWKTLVYYDETSPTGLRWLKPMGLKIKANQIVGYKTDCERWRMSLSNKGYYCSVIIWSLFHKLNDDTVVDHINGNSLDNRLSNLRQVSVSINMRNVKKRRTNKTGKTGISLVQNGNSSYYIAEWVNEEGRSIRLNFSIEKLGKDLAFTLAVQSRDYAISLLPHYTERHGK